MSRNAVGRSGARLAQLQSAFAGHIRDPENAAAPAGLEDRRMAIYRELFFNNINGFLSNNFPVLKKLYGSDRWSALVRDFLVHHRAHTPLFPELPREFLQFIENHRGTDHGDPDFMLELAHYEWVELALELHEAELADIDCDREGNLIDGQPVISPLAWLIRYRYPVHQIRMDYQPESPPETATALVVYRRRDDSVKFLAANPVVARLIDFLNEFPARTGDEHLVALAEEMQTSPDRIRAGGAAALADLADRDIILGTAILPG